MLRFGIGGGGEAVDVPRFPEPSDDEGVDAADDEEAIVFWFHFTLFWIELFLQQKC
jgi:hypothetical protein